MGHSSSPRAKSNFELLPLAFSVNPTPVSLTRPDLWSKLQLFELDQTNAALPFSLRLARDHDWSHSFALEVIDEYKRFLYLAVVANHSVTPSEEVDAAWHLHLCYTSSYWDELCPQVLGRKLHHNPTKGGSDQSELFRNQYQSTLDSYEREFGAKPPQAIWPEVNTRFQPNQHHTLGSESYHFKISKKWTHLTLASTGIAILAAGCSEEFIDGDTTSKEIVLFIVCGFLLLLLLRALFAPSRNKGRRKRRGRDKDSGCGGWFGCSSGGDSGCSSGCGGGCGGD